MKLSHGPQKRSPLDDGNQARGRFFDASAGVTMPGMTDQLHTPHEHADRGTRLGAPTRALTGLFTIVMFPWSLCSRAARAVKNGLRRFAQWSRLRRALVVAAVLATIFGVLWAITPEVAASIGTGALVVGAAILIPAACALLLLLVGKLLGWLGHLVAAVLGPPLRALARALVHAVGRVGRGCTIAFRRVVHSVGVAVLRARLRSSGVRRDTSEPGGATPSPAPLTLPF